MSEPTDGEKVQAAAQKHGIGQYRRHVLLCTGPRCCTEEVGAAAWEDRVCQIAARFPREVLSAIVFAT